MPEIVFACRAGAPFPEDKAQEVGEWLMTLADDPLGVDPHRIVAAARKKDCPVHDCFTWDIEEAANLCWLQEARKIVNHLIVIGPKKKRLPAFFSVQIETAKGSDEYVRAYVPMQRAISEPPLYEQVLEQALRYLKHWTDEYGKLKPLAPVVREAKKLFGVKV